MSEEQVTTHEVEALEVFKVNNLNNVSLEYYLYVLQLRNDSLAGDDCKLLDESNLIGWLHSRDIPDETIALIKTAVDNDRHVSYESKDHTVITSFDTDHLPKDFTFEPEPDIPF